MTGLGEEIVAVLLQRPREAPEQTVESAGDAGGLMREIPVALFKTKSNVRPGAWLEVRRRSGRSAIGELHAQILCGAFFMKAFRY
ncbi:hypothetical protein CCR94_03680 [Rhodoblastus sphagnicola]|uniref:Uncharacterized protein n=1 Tax=Rhodoblastus sphagnicola TaxID=333368 RepID=A0A2S6NDS6_9HYPH|nr:hypothetical protein CCR94_03680 [Rhodoblastus sphagnicola]